MHVESVLDLTQGIEGYFHREELRLLHETTVSVLRQLPNHAIVELGSYCGKSTAVLGIAVKAIGGTSKVYAIDPHEGEITFSDGIQRHPQTLDRFTANITRLGLWDVVELIKMKSFEVVFTKQIGLILIDALHDYESVSRDFRHFYRSVSLGGVIAFHDYWLNNHPGVTRFVDEILVGPWFSKESHVDSLVILRKVSDCLSV
jgi:predicted O-methyltransferase YrrM